MEIDFRPVVRLTTPDAYGVWLLTELDPLDFDTASGLADYGLGPELEVFSLADLREVRGIEGLPIEIDPTFVAEHTLKGYLKAMSGQGAL